MGEPGKHFSYFELLEAFRQPGCAVCRLVEQTAMRSLDALLYEQVNDPITRKRLVLSHGFCNRHAWMLPKIENAALGVALIYKHLIEDALDRLPQASERGRRSLSQRLSRLWRGRSLARAESLLGRDERKPCSVCEVTKGVEREALRVVLQFREEPEFAEAFARSSGLCMPHLCGAARLYPHHPNLGALVADHERRWRDLAGELEELVRKFDYRYAGELPGAESGSWLRAIEVLTGRPSVSGPDGPGRAM